jgi:hypothetical protein
LQWFKELKNIKNNEKYKIYNEGKKYLLDIKNCKFGDDGLYSIKLSDNIITSGNLTVKSIFRN